MAQICGGLPTEDGIANQIDAVIERISQGKGLNPLRKVAQWKIDAC